MQKTYQNLPKKKRFGTYFSIFRLCLVPHLFSSNSRHILLPTCISFNSENSFLSSLEAVKHACFEFSAFRPYWPTCEISLNAHVTNAMLYTRVDTVNKHRVLWLSGIGRFVNNFLLSPFSFSRNSRKRTPCLSQPHHHNSPLYVLCHCKNFKYRSCKKKISESVCVYNED